MSDREVRRKRPSETRTLIFNFYEKLATGDSLTGSPTIGATAGITVGAPTVSSPRISVPVSGGTDAVDYTITCAIGTTLGSLLVLEAVIEVRS